MNKLTLLSLFVLISQQSLAQSSEVPVAFRQKILGFPKLAIVGFLTAVGTKTGGMGPSGNFILPSSDPTQKVVEKQFMQELEKFD